MSTYIPPLFRHFLHRPLRHGFPRGLTTAGMSGILSADGVKCGPPLLLPQKFNVRRASHAISVHGGPQSLFLSRGVPSALAELHRFGSLSPVFNYIGSLQKRHYCLRTLTQRSLKMKNYQQRKRFKRNASKIFRRTRKRLQRVEKRYRHTLAGMLRELQEFDPEQHIKTIISRAKEVRKLRKVKLDDEMSHHWLELMTIEDLYELPKTDYIDKTHGVADKEQWLKVKQQRERYKRESGT